MLLLRAGQMLTEPNTTNKSNPSQMTDSHNGTLLVGFDSAWTSRNSGALVGVLRSEDGVYHELGPPPSKANFPKAQQLILGWQSTLAFSSTIVMLDQPCIVRNAAGQRPVEHIVGSSVSLRYGGMQPASISRQGMFGAEAPLWPFLAAFGGPANPLDRFAQSSVFETYPVLALIALGGVLSDSRPAGRLPKYNPERKKTSSISDWQHVCKLVSSAVVERRCGSIALWLDGISRKAPPRKADHDGLDACVCFWWRCTLPKERGA